MQVWNSHSLPLAARHRTQKVIQPLASLTARDSAIHSLQHTEPIRRHTSTNIWPPVEPHIHTPYQFLGNLKGVVYFRLAPVYTSN